jgi:hypothetical protein
MASSEAVEQPKTKTHERSEDQLDSEVLSAIEGESHRPSAITNVLHKKYDQNAVLKALIRLEKEGKVERDSKKAWIAKGKAGDKGKEKEKRKDKDKEKEKETAKSKE